MAEDLAYLANLPPDRMVEALMLGTAVDNKGGFIIKFLMHQSKKAEILAFFSGLDSQLHDAFKHANKAGRLPKLPDGEHERLVSLMPQISNDDWDFKNDGTRVVVGIKCISFTNGMCFEFPVQSGPPRQYILPTTVARFLGEYIHQHFEDHVRFVPSSDKRH